MKLWRWLVVLAFVAGSLIIAGKNLQVVGGREDKDKDAKQEKDKGKQDDKKKDDSKKDDAKKDDAKKDDSKKEEAKKEEAKQEAKGTGDRWEWKAFDPKGKPFYQ